MHDRDALFFFLPCTRVFFFSVVGVAFLLLSMFYVCFLRRLICTIMIHDFNSLTYERTRIFSRQ